MIANYINAVFRTYVFFELAPEIIFLAQIAVQKSNNLHFE